MAVGPRGRACVGGTWGACCCCGASCMLGMGESGGSGTLDPPKSAVSVGGAWCCCGACCCCCFCSRLATVSEPEEEEIPRRLRRPNFPAKYRWTGGGGGGGAPGPGPGLFWASNFETGATEIKGLLGWWLGGESGQRLTAGAGGGPGDTESVEAGEAERLLQFRSHRSGVISPASLPASMAWSRRCGCMSRCAWVSWQKICILYWLRHFSEQNCSWEAPSWKST